MRASPGAATLSCLLIGEGSVLVVQVHRDLKARLSSDLTIADIDCFAPVEVVVAHVTNRGAANARLADVENCAAARHNALAARSGRGAS